MDKEMDERNRPLTNEELDSMLAFPGYEAPRVLHKRGGLQRERCCSSVSGQQRISQVVPPPGNYNPVRKTVLATPTPTPGQTPGFKIQDNTEIGPRRSSIMCSSRCVRNVLRSAYTQQMSI